MHSSSIILKDEMYDDIKYFLSGTKTVSQFIFDATEEKIKRMKVRDRQSRIQLAEKDKAILEPIVKDILAGFGIS